jgi:hypothetical protein
MILLGLRATRLPNAERDEGHVESQTRMDTTDTINVKSGKPERTANKDSREEQQAERKKSLNLDFHTSREKR